jgi:hypothetical protein
LTFVDLGGGQSWNLNLADETNSNETAMRQHPQNSIKKHNSAHEKIDRELSLCSEANTSSEKECMIKYALTVTETGV